MERARKPFSFSDGREIVVEESTWESASRRTAIEEKARAEKLQANGSGDPVYFYFVESFYAYLASCSTGPVPEPREALALPEADLDGWFLTVVEVNPDSFIQIDYTKKGKVVFRDGSIFEVVSSYLPSVTMKRVRLEEEALNREEDRDHPKDIFSVYLYPILASCSRGDVPSSQEVRSSWPESQIYLWRDGVERENPQWFGSTEEAQKRTLQQVQDVEKKSARSRRRSSAS